jgi:hypothetical protein
MSARFGRNKKRKLIAKREAEIVFMDKENIGLRKQLLVAVDTAKRLQTALNHLTPKPKVEAYTPLQTTSIYSTVVIDSLPMRLELQGDIHPRMVEEYARQFADKVYNDVYGKLREAMHNKNRGRFF